MNLVRSALCLMAALLLPPMAAMAQTAEAPVLSLKTSVTDADGTITLGDIFDNAGAVASTVVGYRKGATAVLDAVAVQSVASRAGARWDNPRGLHRIIVTAGADGAPAMVATASASTPATAAPLTAAGASSAQNRDVLVYTHPMNTGDVVHPEDMQFTQVLAQAVNGDLANTPQAAIGKVVRWPIRQGGLVRAADLMSAVVVKRNENVGVTWSSNGLSLTMSGLAQKDAAIGDVIQVQNPTSKKMIDAVVTGPGQALAGPAADQMRSQMLLSSR